MLTYTTRSGDPALAAVTVDGTVFTIQSGEDGAEGVVTITVTATDADGLSVTLDLKAQIEFVPQGLLRGWRRVLIIDALGESARIPTEDLRRTWHREIENEWMSRSPSGSGRSVSARLYAASTPRGIDVALQGG